MSNDKEDKMHASLTRKLRFKSGLDAKSIAWSSEHHWIACGGRGGSLTVHGLEADKDVSNIYGGGVSTNGNTEITNALVDFTKYTTLQDKAHDKTTTVVAVEWNNQHKKLLTCDDSGLFIVWSQVNGVWLMEMINQQKSKQQCGVQWSPDGSRVCFAYTDGYLMVGSVGGDRLWAQEVGYTMCGMSWSPDSTELLIVAPTSRELHLLSSKDGQLLRKAAMVCSPPPVTPKSPTSAFTILKSLFTSPKPKVPLAIVRWSHQPKDFSSDTNDQVARIAVCYVEAGSVQLMRNATDPTPRLVDTSLRIADLQWNPAGSVLAVLGSATQPQPTTTSTTAVVQFFSNVGQHLSTLTLPGSRCGGVAWEGNGERVVATVDACAYFANMVKGDALSDPPACAVDSD